MTGNPGLVLAQNCYPIEGGYGPFPDLAVTTNALEGTALGTISAVDENGDTYLYAGTTSKLYELTDVTWTDESKGGGYSTGTDESWSFAIWDPTQQVVASNFSDPVQVLTIGGGGAGAFADLFTSTEKPKFRSIAIVKNHLVGGYANSTADGVQPERVHWSASGDITDMDPDAATLCDYQDLETGGIVQRVVAGQGGEYGVIFQQSVIRRMDFSGVPTVFDLPIVDSQRGTPIPRSAVNYGTNTFYIAEDGFFVFTGTGSLPIGTERIDRRFWNEFNVSNRLKVSAAVDPTRKIVCWLYPGEGNSNNVPNKMMAYRWDLGRWSEILIDATLITRTLTQGYTLEGLDAVGANIDTDYTISWDSDFWKGGALSFGAFDTAHKFGSFSGSNLGATFETGETQLFEGYTARVASVRPVTEGTAPQIAVSTRARQVDSLGFEGNRDITTIGEGRVNVWGRFHSFKMTVPAAEEWDFAKGLQIQARRGPRK